MLLLLLLLVSFVVFVAADGMAADAVIIVILNRCVSSNPNTPPSPRKTIAFCTQTQTDNREELVSVGSPLPPYMATAPRQHVRRYVHAFNDTHSAVLYEWCTSVLGEPTRYASHTRKTVGCMRCRKLLDLLSKLDSSAEECRRDASCIRRFTCT